ncbi:hypothetical protein Tco_0983788 [Tanacetum coccineum]
MARLCDLRTLRRAVLSSSFKSGDYDGGRVEIRSELSNLSRVRRTILLDESRIINSYGIDSLSKTTSISSKMKSPPSKGVREVGEVERIGSKVRVGLPLFEIGAIWKYLGNDEWSNPVGLKLSRENL